MDYDLLIAGGGMVGAGLAAALSGQALRIGVVEPSPAAVATPPGYDDRAIALARGTQRIFAAIGVWDRFSAEATPIHRIHVSDRGHFGFTHLTREEEQVDALGYVVPARAIGTALLGCLREQPSVSLLSPAKLRSFNVGDHTVGVEVSAGGETARLATKLLVGADGARSVVREQLGLPVDHWDYGQTAIVATVTTQLPHHNVAYERFTDTGPLAVLPRSGHDSTVVWTVKRAAAEEILGLPEDEFLRRLQARFGYRLGRMERCGERSAWPLQLVRAKQSVAPRTAVIGNAAHTLHPIAGQGLNLGIRDVATLAEVLVDALRAGEDIGAPRVLDRYAEWRRRDQRRVVAFTDGLIRLFSNPLSGMGMVRNCGMLALEVLPPAKRAFSRLAMGQSGRLPRLARGLPL